eukprot:COSAG05_NODE_23240_length_259_cov_0.650000_1_plen_38_part_10
MGETPSMNCAEIFEDNKNTTSHQFANTSEFCHSGLKYL